MHAGEIECVRGEQVLTICRELTVLFWIAHEIFWAANSRGNKEAELKGKTLPRLVALAAILLGFALVYAPWFSVGFLAVKVTPETAFSGIAGVLLCGAGILFTWWSRQTLGTNWSGAVTIKKDHELIQRGPYLIVRHPIYAGSLIALLGSAVAMSELKGFLAVVLVFVGLLKKINEEEIVLESHFSEYRLYKLRVKKLIPFIY